MKRKAPPLRSVNGDTFAVSEFAYHVRNWLDDGESRQHSARTIDSRRRVMRYFAWWLGHAEETEVGRSQVRSFLAYLARDHTDEGGRYGNPRNVGAVSAATSVSYFNILQAFFAFLVEERALDSSPMETLKRPIERRDQIVTFSVDQIDALIREARQSLAAKRDEALILFFLDTGARASELCELPMKHLDTEARTASVLGKGNKRRKLPFSRTTARALWAYLAVGETRAPYDPVFVAARGHTPGEALTRSGVGQIIRRLGRAAGIDGVRSSPHTFRHTFAIEFLRAGGNVFTLKELLGHTSLAMVNRYVAIAQADIESQHRRYSPVDRMRRRKGADTF